MPQFPVLTVAAGKVIVGAATERHLRPEDAGPPPRMQANASIMAGHGAPIEAGIERAPQIGKARTSNLDSCLVEPRRKRLRRSKKIVVGAACSPIRPPPGFPAAGDLARGPASASGRLDFSPPRPLLGRICASSFAGGARSASPLARGRFLKSSRDSPFT